MTRYALTFMYDTEPGGVGTVLRWGEPEEEVEEALYAVPGVSWIGFDGGTAFGAGAPRDVTLYVDQLDLDGIKTVLAQFPHGSSWDVDVVDEEWGDES